MKGNLPIIDWGGLPVMVEWSITGSLYPLGPPPVNHLATIHTISTLLISGDKKIRTDWVGVEQEVK